VQSSLLSSVKKADFFSTLKSVLPRKPFRSLSLVVFAFLNRREKIIESLASVTFGFQLYLTSVVGDIDVFLRRRNGFWRQRYWTLGSFRDFGLRLGVQLGLNI
jgi:hypothetical protein